MYENQNINIASLRKEHQVFFTLLEKNPNSECFMMQA